MTANGVPSCGNLRKKQRRRIAGPSLQTSALPLGYGARASKVTKTPGFLNPADLPSVLPPARVHADPHHRDARSRPSVARRVAHVPFVADAALPPSPRRAALGHRPRDSRDAQDL